MSRLIKDYIEVADHQSLDALIDQLSAIRERLPEQGEAKVRMRGDDRVGRHLCIVAHRPLTAEEADCESRYGHNNPVSLRAVA